MKSIMEVFEGLVKSIVGMEPVKLDLIYPELSRPEVHQVVSL